MIEQVLEERGARYGKFIEHATIAQGIQDVMRQAPNWKFLDPDMKQSLTIIADKIARILNGQKDYDDNWVDIAGYSTLIVNRIRENELL